ncbi:unnamed protein product [Ostreobium quekettii]|uniref:Uncharacterized protein n=1 Tax=Ostreobium quekettii TaxID=121088 RepID=A0A8S1IMW4_9CHLO|nr:unnamed protein product [Ostreobium quekettii]
MAQILGRIEGHKLIPQYSWCLCGDSSVYFSVSWNMRALRSLSSRVHYLAHDRHASFLVQEVLQSLEEPALQLMESLRTVDDNGGEPPYNHLHCHALRSATCLRHLLKELSGAWTCNEAGAATPEQSLEGLETPRLEKCELQLLQHHMLWVLSCKGDTLCRLVSAEGLPCCGGAGSLWRCIHGVMSAWVSMHRGHTDIWPEICCIVDAMEESGNGTTPDERVSLSDVPVSLTGGPLASARSASVSVADFRIELPRCSTTMLVCERPPQWHCVVCNRGYALPPQALYGDDGLPPECLFCGMRLTTMTTRHVLAAPGSLRPTLRASGT